MKWLLLVLFWSFGIFKVLRMFRVSEWLVVRASFLINRS